MPDENCAERGEQTPRQASSERVDADWLNEQMPSMAIETKSNRFDVHLLAALAG